MYSGGKGSFKKRPLAGYIVSIFLAFFLLTYASGYYFFGSSTETTSSENEHSSQGHIRGSPNVKTESNQIVEDIDFKKNAHSALKTRSQHKAMHPDGVDDTVTAVVECTTTSGNLTLDIRSGWAPKGAQRFFELIKLNFFVNLPFFRVCPRYISNPNVKAHYVSIFSFFLFQRNLVQNMSQKIFKNTT